MTQPTLEQTMRIAIGHHQAGRLDQAEAVYRAVLARFPGHGAALHLLGVLAGQMGRSDTAIDLISRAIASDPGVEMYHGNLGEIYRRSGQWERAIACFHRAIELKPDYAEAHNNLGNVLWEKGRSDEALALYRHAIKLKPNYAEAHSNVGNVLKDQGRLDEAIAAYRVAIGLKPDLADGYNNMGNALLEQDRFDEAIAAYDRAVQLAPDYAEAHNNRGNVFLEQGRLDEAIAAYDRAVQLAPDYAEALNNRGNVFKDQGRIDEALACFRRAVELKPGYTEAASNLLFTLHYHPRFDAQAILEEHRHWARRFAEPLAAELAPHPNDRAPHRRLRIGFLSPDFRNHPVGRSLLPFFSEHDCRQADYIGYCDAQASDRVTAKLKAMADEWHNTVGLRDPQVADRIRADRIDILVDLTLHTANNRILVFARKPAPIQVTMLGPPATTGLNTIDYRLTDHYLDPPGTSDGDYTEQSIRLPHCFWVYQPPDEAPPVGALPALTNGFVTFGCLNQFAKVTRPTLQLWVKILQCLPGSRLVLQSQPGSHVDELCKWFRHEGIAPDRVEFARRVPRLQYLHRYRDLDLCLDPFPYNGHTSTLDALWMGVPVITLAGRTAVGRGGVSILANAGLPELIAHTPDQYVAIAVAVASDRTRLSELRARLRQQMRSSPLLDGRQFAADIDAAFRQMWRSWCGQ